MALAVEFHRAISGTAALSALVGAVIILAFVSKVKLYPISLLCCSILGVCFTSISLFLTLHV